MHIAFHKSWQHCFQRCSPHLPIMFGNSCPKRERELERKWCLKRIPHFFSFLFLPDPPPPPPVRRCRTTDGVACALPFIYRGKKWGGGTTRTEEGPNGSHRNPLLQQGFFGNKFLQIFSRESRVEMSWKNFFFKRVELVAHRKGQKYRKKILWPPCSELKSSSSHFLLFFLLFALSLVYSVCVNPFISSSSFLFLSPFREGIFDA